MIKKIDDQSFGELNTELEEIIGWFESDEVDLEQSVDKFERGMKLSEELKKRLDKTQQRIQKLSEQ